MLFNHPFKTHVTMGSRGFSSSKNMQKVTLVVNLLYFSLIDFSDFKFFLQWLNTLDLKANDSPSAMRKSIEFNAFN